jgi:hypothetical protein
MCTLIEIPGPDFDGTVQTPAQLEQWLATVTSWPIALHHPADVERDGCLCGVDVEGIARSHGIELHWSPVGYWHGYPSDPWKS